MAAGALAIGVARSSPDMILIVLDKWVFVFHEEQFQNPHIQTILWPDDLWESAGYANPYSAMHVDDRRVIHSTRLEKSKWLYYKH